MGAAGLEKSTHNLLVLQSVEFMEFEGGYTYPEKFVYALLWFSEKLVLPKNFLLNAVGRE